MSTAMTLPVGRNVVKEYEVRTAGAELTNSALICVLLASTAYCTKLSFSKYNC